MTNHPNRNWRRRWQVDLSAAIATHDSGLEIQFRKNTDGGYDGEIVAGQPEFPENIFHARKAAQRYARLMREAGDIFRERLEAKND